MSDRLSHRWLQPAERHGGAYVHHSRRLVQIRDQLASPQTQFPSLIVFLGNRKKDVALRALFPDNTLSQRQPYIQLDVDSRTTFADHPLLFSHCDAKLEFHKADRIPRNYEEIPLRWPLIDLHHASDIILSRAMFMFTDVICIFADDLGGLDAVRNMLTRWAMVGRNASSLEYRPRVLIVMETDHKHPTYETLDEMDFFFMLAQDRNVTEVFVTPSLHRLPGQALSDIAQHCSLKNDLLKLTDISRRDRKEEGYLFSVMHMAFFFQTALDHVCRAPQAPFDFVRGARAGIEVGQSHRFHLRDFLVVTRDRGWKLEDQASHIASTLLIDAYPPGSHCKSRLILVRSMTDQSSL